MLINVKMPTFVGILIFISMIDSKKSLFQQFCLKITLGHDKDLFPITYLKFKRTV